MLANLKSIFSESDYDKCNGRCPSFVESNQILDSDWALGRQRVPSLTLDCGCLRPSAAIPMHPRSWSARRAPLRFSMMPGQGCHILGAVPILSGALH